MLTATAAGFTTLGGCLGSAYPSVYGPDAEEQNSGMIITEYQFSYDSDNDIQATVSVKNNTDNEQDIDVELSIHNNDLIIDTAEFYFDDLPSGRRREEDDLLWDLENVNAVSDYTITGEVGDLWGSSTSVFEYDGEILREQLLAEFKREASEVPYSTLKLNSQNFVGDYIHFPEMLINQRNEKSDGTDIYTAYVNDIQDDPEDEIVIGWESPQFSQGDIVEFWGEFVGLQTFETAIGTQTLPVLNGEEMQHLADN